MAFGNHRSPMMAAEPWKEIAKKDAICTTVRKPTGTAALRPAKRTFARRQMPKDMRIAMKCAGMITCRVDWKPPIVGRKEIPATRVANSGKKNSALALKMNVNAMGPFPLLAMVTVWTTGERDMAGLLPKKRVEIFFTSMSAGISVSIKLVLANLPGWSGPRSKLTANLWEHVNACAMAEPQLTMMDVYRQRMLGTTTMAKARSNHRYSSETRLD
mmetsp:Transcript_14018/g.32842  ORF Transcript_14018/g.32842 Transcript_14018/m.32842 type:complete len:215 (-) Transcript_14018:1941-2585(-)